MLVGLEYIRRTEREGLCRMTQLPSHRELELFKRVAEIIESARGRVARSVNSAMVQAYWLIGREIVEIEQQGKKRATTGVSRLRPATYDERLWMHAGEDSIRPG